MLIFIWYVTFYPLRCNPPLVYSRAREGAAFAGNDSMFLPLSPQPDAPRVSHACSLAPPPFSVLHNERSRNAGGQCSRKADSGIAVWPGTVHRSPSPLHLLHPRERTSPHVLPYPPPLPLLYHSLSPRTARRSPLRPTAAHHLLHHPQPSFCLHLVPAAAGL